MVVFTCNYCGESLRKPTVEKHYNLVCRKVKNLTCVDCFKDFRGEEFVSHTKCVTEEERYAPKGSVPSGIQKKGEVKQESWVEMIRSIIQADINMPSQHKDLLMTISQHNNVPRKKHKFLNYIKSATGGRIHENNILAVWNIIEKYKEKQSKSNNTEETVENNAENSVSKDEDKEEADEKPKKKRKKTDSDQSEISKNESKENKKKMKVGNSEKKDEQSGQNGLNEEIKIKKKKRKNLDQNGITDAEKTSQNGNFVNDNQENSEAVKKAKKQKKKSKENESKIVEENNIQEITNENCSQIKTKKKQKDEVSNLEGLIEAKNNIKKKKHNKLANPTEDVDSTQVKENNQSSVETEVSQLENSKESANSFSIDDTIVKILTKKNQISLEKLEKKVTNAYLKHMQQTEVTEKFLKKIRKRLKRGHQWELEDNIVRLT